MLKELMFNIISFLNPIAAAAIMLSLVKYSEIKDVSRKTSITVFVASVIMFGGVILKLFGINIPLIKAIGGVVLLIISINMIQRKELAPTNATKDEHLAAQEKDDVAIIPLAIPILFGAGVITNIIVLSEKANNFLSIMIFAFLVYLILRNAVFISKILGVNRLKIITRIMELVIGAIAFLFLVGGIKALWMS